VVDIGAEEVAALIGKPGEVLFHYTSLDTAVRYILPTGELRMSPFSTMRDPRKYQRWRPTAAGRVADDQDAREWDRYTVEMDDRLNELKDRFELLALTMDDLEDQTVYGRAGLRTESPLGGLW
jgi:hypothetical protein